MSDPTAVDASTDAFRRDVVTGLSKRPRSIPSKYFYDARGSRLFDRITTLDAYYLTRTERQILETYAGEIAEIVGPRVALVEFGSGSSEKTHAILDALREAAAYVPIDISAEHLEATAERLRLRYPGLPILPVAADYTRSVQLPPLPPETERRVVFFPGSTLGNFDPDKAHAFLAVMARTAGPHGGVLVGIDLDKDPDRLLRAYNDEEGVTAAFNINLLRRINRELGADFDPDAWHHQARYDGDKRRVEMHLVSDRLQTVHLPGRAVTFEAGESIHTENSYKYTPEMLAERAAAAGLARTARWTDPRGWFAVEYFEHH